MTHLCHLIMIHTQHIFHQVVGFTDQLHVAVLNAVMDHLYKVSRTLVTNLSVKSNQPVTDYCLSCKDSS